MAVIGTVLGLALLLSFKTPADVPVSAGGRLPVPPSVAGSAPAVAGRGPTPTPTLAGRLSPISPSPSPVRGAASPAASPGTSAAAAAPVVTPSPVVAPSVAAVTPAPTKAAAADVAGPVEQTPYGDVQVQVKIAGGKIIDVVALQLPSDRRRSAQISQYAEPILHDEALRAQSAQIDLISGATWTSGGYQASLQGALDKVPNA